MRKGGEMLISFFEKEKIEYKSVIPYSLCKETSPQIMARECFKPRTVILFLIPYYAGETVNISRYASARDYHIYIGDVTERLISVLRAAFPDNSFRGYGDRSPIDERHAALISGLGILGDNGLLINEKYGSYVFIADVVCDIEPERLQALTAPQKIRECTHCGACKRACPTGVLRAESSDCLSAVTQKKGELAEWEKALMRKYNTAWGCDECQVACPHNRNPVITPIEFFLKDRIEELDSAVLSEMSDEEFSSRAFAWRKRKTVERNIEILENKI